jgi:hypothetical protein
MGKQVGTPKKLVDIIRTLPAQLRADGVSDLLSEKECLMLHLGLENLEDDIVSALTAVDSAQMLSYWTEVRRKRQEEQLTLARKHLNSSLHSIRDWLIFVGGKLNDLKFQKKS